MNRLILFWCIAFMQFIYAQPPIDWQKTLGGNNNDFCKKIIQTSDQGYLVFGSSLSNISGNKTVNSFGSYDIWLVKLNSVGAISWQKTFGGSGSETINSAVQTGDGGYILGGISDSNISGNKTENSKGDSDYWIIKLDALGTIQWQKTIGGNRSEGISSIEETTDGGYIVGGTSTSDVSGDKTEPCFIGPDFLERRDYWIVKLDSVGSIIWQNTIGGTLVEVLRIIKQTPDGGYFVGGYSASDISGDKTENARGPDTDYWVLKLNATGNIVWQKTVGGYQVDQLTDMAFTDDGGVLLCGWTTSDISGDKTDYSRGNSDFWIVKLDYVGTIIWQKSIGGSGREYFPDITTTTDNNFIISGNSDSNISGDKNENSRGSSDIWMLKINPLGNIIWQKTIGGSLGEGVYETIQTIDGGYAICATSLSNISGEKTENCIGEADYWVIKLAPENLSTNSNKEFSEIEIFPNPTIKDVFINFKDIQKEVQTEVKNVLGEILNTQNYKDINSFQISLNNSSGIYFLTITIENLSKTFKIVKE